MQSEQIYYASHLNFGAYHGGVVCDDVSTHTEFIEMPLSVQELLNDIKKFLLRYYGEIEKIGDQDE